MPPERARGSPMPPASIALKERMIPVTVPSRPSNGDTPAMVPSVLMKRSSSCTTWRPVSSSRSMRISRGRLRFMSPVASNRPRGEFCSSPLITLSVTWLASINCHTRCGSSRGSTRLSCSVHRRSRMMAAATIEQRMIGHISGPPARTISHILNDPKDRYGRLCHGPSYRNRRTSPLRIHLLESRASMPRALLKRIIPAPQTLRGRWPVRLCGERIADPKLWTLQRRAVTYAFGAGLAICFVPLPIHLLLAVLVALIWRINLPVMYGTTWVVANPFTLVPLYYFAYRVGVLILQVPPHHFRFVADWKWFRYGLAPRSEEHTSELQSH